MNEIEKFLNTHYKNALKLVENFNITKKYEWTAKDYLNELYIQVGHVYTVLYKNKNVQEKNRLIENLGDELADVLLQVINLAHYLNIDFYEITSLKNYESHDISDISILLGQLTEIMMEMLETRFKKIREGFNNSYEFMKDRLFKIFLSTYQIAIDHELDMSSEFELMLKDANAFLKRFSKNNMKEEYIDIYDENENLLGFCEKKIAHEKGYWHKVFGCVIFNSKKNTVFLQIKNPKHNQIHSQELLEITCGGHLISGEVISDGVREIKEETGISVNFSSLDFLLKRKINKTIHKNYKIKEFQYYFALDKAMKITDFKDFDSEEIMGFVELNIQDVFDLINKKKNSINGLNNDGSKTLITLNDLDQDYIKDKLYLTLLLNLKQKDKNSTKKLRKLNNLIKQKKKKNPLVFYFEKGRVIKRQEYKKGELRFTVMKVNKDRFTSEYLVYLLIQSKNKSIPQMLSKKFSSVRGTKKYFEELCNLVENHSNKEIINLCYKEYYKK